MQLLAQEMWSCIYFLETGTVAVAESAPEHRTDTGEPQWCTMFGPSGIDCILYIIVYFSSFKGKKNQGKIMLLQSLGVSFWKVTWP